MSLMQQLATLMGACPVCGMNVPRAHTQWEDGPHDVYDCPQDGAIEYATRFVSLLGPVGLGGR